MRPPVTAFSLGVAFQIKDFNLTIPDGLTAKSFKHGHSLNVS